RILEAAICALCQSPIVGDRLPDRPLDALLAGVRRRVADEVEVAERDSRCSFPFTEERDVDAIDQLPERAVAGWLDERPERHDLSPLVVVGSRRVDPDETVSRLIGVSVGEAEIANEGIIHFLGDVAGSNLAEEL